MTGVTGPYLEIVSLSDIPAGTGMGSSGSFTTALLKALHTFRKNIVRPAEIAAQACQIEIEKLHEPVGKQDQYIAAFGNPRTPDDLQAHRLIHYASTFGAKSAGFSTRIPIAPMSSAILAKFTFV